METNKLDLASKDTCAVDLRSHDTVFENPSRVLESSQKGIPLSGQSIFSTLRTQPTPVSLNSYKFNKPRVYVKNEFKSEEKSTLELLREISLLLGNKVKPKEYNDQINVLLSMSKKKTKRENAVATLNLSQCKPNGLKQMSISLNDTKISSQIGRAHV